MFKVVMLFGFVFWGSSYALANQCEYTVYVNNSPLATYQGNDSEECRRVHIRCLKRAENTGGVCLDSRSTRGGRVPRGSRVPRTPRGPDRDRGPRDGGIIRVGDTVFPMSWTHTYGATVLQYNPVTREFRVKSNSSGSVFTFVEADLAVTQGCLINVCVSDKVFPKSWGHEYGAQVLAINYAQSKLIVKSNSSGSVFVLTLNDVMLSDGCVDQICVGDKVFPLSWGHDYGAQVIATDSQYGSMVKVKSNSSGSIFDVEIDNLALPHGCLSGVCVGQRVYPRDWGHALGAEVIAISARQGIFIIKSNSSGSIFKKTIYDL